MSLLQGCTDSPPVDPQAFRKIEDQPGLTAGNDDRQINQTSTDPPSVSAADEPNDAGPEESIALVPEEVYRPSDNRPRHDDARAAELGIRRYESQHLLLYTDIDPAIAQTLPPLMDQAYAAWVEYFGPLPPDREGTEYQLTGYIMRDRDRFLAAGMLPDAAQTSLVHGIHRGSEFWMNEQEYDYYRRHLMIHEGTHCYTMAVPGRRPPIWYLEGIAELFGTHRIDENGEVQFGVMTEERSPYVGFGRVEMIRDAVDAGEYRSVEGVVSLNDADFVNSRTDPYAWSWAFCKFLDTHPKYNHRFQQLARHVVGSEFYRILEEEFAPDRHELNIEWELFARTIDYGYDIPRAAIDFLKGEPLPPRASIATDVTADRGWSSSGVWLESGRTYEVTARGEVVLANDPEPWISHPDGVSIRYAAGRPIGRVVGIIIDLAQPGEAEPSAGEPLETLDIGATRTLKPSRSGTLYLRVNDFWSELADNEGAYRVTIRTPD